MKLRPDGSKIVGAEIDKGKIPLPSLPRAANFEPRRIEPSIFKKMTMITNTEKSNTIGPCLISKIKRISHQEIRLRKNRIDVQETENIQLVTRQTLCNFLFIYIFWLARP